MDVNKTYFAQDKTHNKQKAYYKLVKNKAFIFFKSKTF